MPPLRDDIIPGVIDAFGRVVEQVSEAVPEHGDTPDGFEGRELAAPPEEEMKLAARVDAMQVEAGQARHPSDRPRGRDTAEPIIQFPEEEAQGESEGRECYMHVGMTADMLAHMQKMQQGQEGGVSSGSWGQSPRPSDMIPALQGLSSLQVSFGSVGDVSMPPVDTVLGKRGAEEPEVQGQRLELSLGLNYGHKQVGGKAKKGKTQENKEVKRNVEVVYTRNKKLASTGRLPTGELTRPNVWSRQEQ
jgi:hypothetical protein